MKIDVFCGWGEANDVGINLHRTPEEIAAYPGELVPIDLNSQEAREIAAKLIACADRADALEREYREFCERDREADQPDEG